MITLMTGTRVTLEIAGEQVHQQGRVDSIAARTVAVQLDPDQPATQAVHSTGAAMLVHVDGGQVRFETAVYDVQPRDRRLLLIKPGGVKARDRRVGTRVPIANALRWSQLTAAGQLTAERRGITVDVSISGIAFETVAAPPEIGAIVAVSGVNPEYPTAILVTVVGVDRPNARAAKSVARCELVVVDELTCEHLAALVEDSGS